MKLRPYEFEIDGGITQSIRRAIISTGAQTNSPIRQISVTEEVWRALVAEAGIEGTVVDDIIIVGIGNRNAVWTAVFDAEAALANLNEACNKLRTAFAAAIEGVARAGRGLRTHKELMDRRN